MKTIFISIIHLENTPWSEERRISFTKELLEQGITNYKIWPGVIEKIPFLGINKAHKSLVKWAKENHLPEICIAEDDVCFLGKGAFDFYIRNKPEDYDIYFGGLSQIIRKNGDKIIDFAGFTLYTVHNKFYDRYLSASDTNHIDRAMKGLGDFYLSPRIICSQKAGFSYNKKRYTDYSHLLKQYDLYKNE